jgi:hypothetical protein
MNIELHVQLTGVLMIILGTLHAVIPRYFRWKVELAPLGLITRQIVYVHTFFIGLVLFLIGTLCLFSASDLVNSPFGKKIAFGLFIFWAIRFIFQFLVYSSKTWKGKKFETSIHVLASLLWFYFTFVFYQVSIGERDNSISTLFPFY